MKAKSIPYLTVATLTKVAFLRSSRIRKLPAAEEERHLSGAQQHLFKLFDLNPAGILPTNRQVGLTGRRWFNGLHKRQLHIWMQKNGLHVSTALEFEHTEVMLIILWSIIRGLIACAHHFYQLLSITHLQWICRGPFNIYAMAAHSRYYST